MNVLMVRAKIKEENVADAQAAIGKVIQALDQTRPADVRYTASVLGDGATFIALLELQPDGGNPLAPVPAYAEFVESLKQWYAEPPIVERMTVVGSYQLF
ncbi:MAG TPA: hypothetical protein VMC83_10850 [Streptosporangiaceae bacterium]|nr:hypothetical protein [Streptosporangiaceae bacterium]